MKLYVTFLALFGLLTFASSCGDAAGKRLSSSNSKTTQFLLDAQEGVNNFGSALDGQASGTASCSSVNGLPTDAFGTGNYYIDALPCALRTNTKNLETLQGIMAVYAGLLCAIEGQVDFNYASSVTTHSVTVDPLDSCLTGISVFGTNSIAVTVKEQALPGPSNWTYKISVDLPSSGPQIGYAGKRMYVYLREDGAKKGIKVSIGDYNSGTNTDTNFLGLFVDIDSSINTLRFDMYSGSKHQRGVLVGTDSQFSGISTFYGAHTVISSSQVVSYYANSVSTGYQYQAIPGGICYPVGNCSSATQPSAAFSDLTSNTSVLTARLTSSTDGVLTFTTALPTQFLP